MCAYMASRVLKGVALIGNDLQSWADQLSAHRRKDQLHSLHLPLPLKRAANSVHFFRTGFCPNTTGRNLAVLV